MSWPCGDEQRRSVAGERPRCRATAAPTHTQSTLTIKRVRVLGAALWAVQGHLWVRDRRPINGRHLPAPLFRIPLWPAALLLTTGPTRIRLTASVALALLTPPCCPMTGPSRVNWRMLRTPGSRARSHPPRRMAAAWQAALPDPSRAAARPPGRRPGARPVAFQQPARPDRLPRPRTPAAPRPAGGRAAR